MNKLTSIQICGKRIRISASLDADGKPQYWVSFYTDGTFTLDGLHDLTSDIKEDLDNVLTFYPDYEKDKDGKMVKTGKYTLYNTLINQFEALSRGAVKMRTELQMLERLATAEKMGFEAWEMMQRKKAASTRRKKERRKEEECNGDEPVRD